jgi:hypothetical protein
VATGQIRVAAARLRQAFVAAAARDNRYRLRRAEALRRRLLAAKRIVRSRCFMAVATLRDVF